MKLSWNRRISRSYTMTPQRFISPLFHFILVLCAAQNVIATRVPLSSGFTMQSSPHGQARGGNLTITIIELSGLTGLDSFGPFSQTTDAFVEISVSGTVRQTQYIHNTRNPVWPNGGETLHFGAKVSNSLMQVRVFDFDDGFEGEDDLITSRDIPVMDCSCFVSDVGQSTCDKEICIEEAWYPLLEGENCGGRETWPWSAASDVNAKCIRMRFKIVPFQLKIEMNHVAGASFGVTTASVKRSNDLGIATPGSWGRPWMDDANSVLDDQSRNFEIPGQGLMLRTSNTDRAKTDKGPYVTVSSNLRATYFLFSEFNVAENNGEIPVDEVWPTWVTTNSSWVASPARALVAGTTTRTFVSRSFVADAGAFIELGAPGIGRNGDIFSSIFLISTMEVSEDYQPPDIGTDFWGTALLMGELLLILPVFSFITRVTLSRSNFRLDRVETVLLMQAARGPEQNVLAFLFECYENGSKDNSDFRRNLFYAKWGSYLVLSVLPLSVVSYGIIAASTAVPSSIGLAALFIGTALFLLHFTWKSWRHHRWRMNVTIMKSLAISALCFFLFTILAVLLDSRVWHDSTNPTPYSIFSITCIAMTSNMLAIIWMLFVGDENLRGAYKYINNLTLEISGGDAPKGFANTETAPWTVLLTPGYTIDHSDPEFRDNFLLATVFSLPESRVKQLEKKWYRISLLILLVYSITVYYTCEPDYKSQGFGLSFATCILDSVVFLLRRGPCKWTTAKFLFICFAGRCSLTFWAGRWWIVGIGSAYLLFGFFLGMEIIDRRLGFLGVEQASAISYFGKIFDKEEMKVNDVSVQPSFVLGYLSLIYLVVLLGFVFTDESTSVTISLFGIDIAMWVFGVAAFVIVVVVTVMGLAQRSLKLQHQELLQSDSYLFFKIIDAPIQWILLAELIVIIASLMVYFVTQSSVFVICAMLLPVILGSGYRALNQWIANDYSLLEDPKKRVQSLEAIADGDESSNGILAQLGKARQKFNQRAAPTNGEGSLFQRGKFMPKGLGGFMKPNKNLKGKKMRESRYNLLMEDAEPGTLEKDLSIRSMNADSNKPDAAEATPDNKVENDETVDPEAKETEAAEDAAAPQSSINNEEKTPEGPLAEDEEKKEGDEESSNKDEEPKPETENEGSTSTELVVAGSSGEEPGKSKAKHKNFSMKMVRVSRKPKFGSKAQEIRKAMKDLFNKITYLGDETDPVKMTAYQAFFKGCLTKTDYLTIFSLSTFIVVVFCVGIIFPSISRSFWWGHLIWLGTFIVASSFLPIWKFFGTYQVTTDMKWMVVMAFFLEVLCVTLLFHVAIGGDYSSSLTMVLFSMAIIWPWILTLGTALFYWRDNDWVMPKTVRKLLPVLNFYPLILTIQMFMWGGIHLGVIALLAWIFAMGAFKFVSVWSRSGFYLPTRYQDIFNIALFAVAILFLIVGLALPGNTDMFLCLSVSVVCLVLKYSADLIRLYVSIPTGTPIFFSSFIFPIYVFEPESGTIRLENGLGKAIFGIKLSILMWGVFTVILVDPLDTGIGILCFAIISVCSSCIYLMSQTPLYLSKAMLCIDKNELWTSALQATEEFELRKKPLELECPELDDGLAEEKKLNKKLSMYKSRKTLANANLIVNDKRYTAKETTVVLQKAKNKLVNTKTGKRRRDGPYTIRDVYSDVWYDGHGPFALLTLGGLVYHIYTMYRNPVKKRNKVYNADAKKENKDDVDWLDDLVETLGAGGDVLEVRIYDHDQTSFDDLLGTVSLNLDELTPNEESTEWYQLTRIKKENPKSESKPKKSGWGIPKKKKKDEPDEKEEEEDDDEEEESDEDDDVLDENTVRGDHGELRELTGQVKLTIKVKLVDHNVAVFATVHEARDLPAADKGNTSDPYCVLQCGDYSHKTGVVKKTLNPSFEGLERNNKFTFPSIDDTLSIQIQDEDFLTSESLGEVTVPLVGLPAGKELVEWHNIIGGQGKTKATGKIKVAITLSDPVDEGGLAMSKATLSVAIICARRIRAADRGGTSDPYCVARCGKEVFRTQTVKKTLNPDWGEEYTFNSQDVAPPEEDISTEQVDAMDLWQVYVQFPWFDKNLDREFEEEYRLAVLFQMLIIVASQARISKESVLFNRFLRENRFKLLANGVGPPSNIFKSQSWASVDVAVVATWLNTLSPEQHERFNDLKFSFSEEIHDAELRRISQEKQLQEHAQKLWDWQQQFDFSVAVKRYEEFEEKRQKRALRGITEELEESEDLINAKEYLDEIEAGEYCIAGEGTRKLQFSDPEFPPDNSAIRGVGCEAMIHSEWRPVSSINPDSQLFDGGTDPDDIFHGLFNDLWFLSAVSILAASGSLGDEEVDPLVAKLFINHEKSDTGAYGVRLYKNSQWETVVVDDILPMRKEIVEDEEITDLVTLDHAGVACSYSKHLDEFWVPLVEKAYAKYYGGYRFLENGYVHHALNALTGCNCEELFLASETQGSAKQRFWEKLVRFYRNGFLMGCGTISNDVASAEQLDSGLVFGACYVIFEIRYVDGHRLIKLRNPPGDHGEWAGDWGDNSETWTRRMKQKLGWSNDDDDGTFWMAYDDFVLSYRSLYVCHYYHESKWKKTKLQGSWLSQKTAMGLPHAFNTSCKTGENPQWTITIDRPMDLHFKATQTENGTVIGDAQPFVMLLLKTRFIQHSSGVREAATVQELSRDALVCMSGNPSSEREKHMSVSLQPGTYTLLVATYLPGQEGPFEIEIDSREDIVVHQIYPDTRTWEQKRGTGLVSSGIMKGMKSARKTLVKPPPAKLTEGDEKEKENDDDEDEEEDADPPQEGEEPPQVDSSTNVETNSKPSSTNPADKRQTLSKRSIILPDTSGGASAAGGVNATTAATTSSSDWVEQYDSTAQATYYYNTKTFESSWEVPPGYQAQANNTQSTASAQPAQTGARSVFQRRQVDRPGAFVPQNQMAGMQQQNPMMMMMQQHPQQHMAAAAGRGNPWVQQIDPHTQHVYYYNQQTGESSWTPPPGM